MTESQREDYERKQFAAMMEEFPQAMKEAIEPDLGEFYVGDMGVDDMVDTVDYYNQGDEHVQAAVWSMLLWWKKKHS